MDEGTLQLEHQGHVYHARWVHDRTGVVRYGSATAGRSRRSRTIAAYQLRAWRG
jgi:hypothetical protein